MRADTRGPHVLMTYLTRATREHGAQVRGCLPPCNAESWSTPRLPSHQHAKGQAPHRGGFQTQASLMLTFHAQGQRLCQRDWSAPVTAGWEGCRLHVLQPWLLLRPGWPRSGPVPRDGAAAPGLQLSDPQLGCLQDDACVPAPNPNPPGLGVSGM